MSDPTTIEPTTSLAPTTGAAPIEPEHNVAAMMTILIVYALVILFVVKPLTLRFRKWEFNLDFGTAPLIGVVLLLIFTVIDGPTLVRGIRGTETIVPWAILIIFYSLAYLCVSWDMTGMFGYIAKRVLMAAGSDGRKIFFYFYTLSSLLTVFTSNDIVILVLTPIICYIANYTGMNPVPYLIPQFFAANIWSVFLVIGNPTNIIVAEAYRLKFLEYTGWMALPTITAGLTSLVMMYFIFRSQIPTDLKVPDMGHPTIYDFHGACLATATMLSCLLTLAITQWISIPLWVVCLSAGSVLFFYDLGRDTYYYIARRNRQTYEQLGKEEIEAKPLTSEASMEENMDYWNRSYGKMREVLSRLPWKILPFVVSMFILVEGLNHTGWVDLFARGLAWLVNSSAAAGIFVVGVVSALTCSLINNQPMTILFTHILQNENYVADPITKMASMFALIVGSNFGANITLVGALAGLMWHKILSDNKIKNIDYFIFMKYGAMITPVVAFNCFLMMYIEFVTIYYDQLHTKAVEQGYVFP